MLPQKHSSQFRSYGKSWFYFANNHKSSTVDSSSLYISTLPHVTNYQKISTKTSQKLEKGFPSFSKYHQSFMFSFKIFCWKKVEVKKFNSAVGVFFLFPMTSRIQVCRVVRVLYITSIGCHRRWEARGWGLSELIFTYFQTIVNTFLFFYRKKRFFCQRLHFFDKWVFFSKKSILWRNCYK